MLRWARPAAKCGTSRSSSRASASRRDCPPERPRPPSPSGVSRPERHRPHFLGEARGLQPQPRAAHRRRRDRPAEGCRAGCPGKAPCVASAGNAGCARSSPDCAARFRPQALRARWTCRRRSGRSAPRARRRPGSARCRATQAHAAAGMGARQACESQCRPVVERAGTLQPRRRPALRHAGRQPPRRQPRAAGFERAAAQGGERLDGSERDQQRQRRGGRADRALARQRSRPPAAPPPASMCRPCRRPCRRALPDD